jgi:AraC-like DNA-binding protein
MSVTPDAPACLTLRVAAGSDKDFELWRWALSPVWDADVVAAEARPAFSFHSRSYILGDASVGTTRATGGTRFRRTGRQIAIGGGDHILVVSYDRGGQDMRAGEAWTEVRPGDVAFLDLSRPADMIAAPNAGKTCLLPRRMLRALLTRPDDLHGSVIRAGQPFSGLLRANMQLMLTTVPGSPAGQRQNLVAAMAHLVAASAGPARDAMAPVDQTVSAARMNQIRAAIEAHLGDPDLGPDKLLKTFPVSRASLYRLFEPLGGIAGYIQKRRLVRAHRDLTDPALFGLRVSQIAGRWGFAGHAAFSRAFKARYGMKPSDARAQACDVSRAALVQDKRRNTSFGTLNRWLQGFAGAAD